MYILGLNTFHADSAAALVHIETGQLVAAVAEERLNRIKHFAGFPERAINECLRIAGARAIEIAHVAIARDSRANLRAKLSFAVRNLGRIRQLARQRLRRRAEVDSVPKLLERVCGVSAARVHRVEHHLAHMASAFLVSPFERAALLSIDGFGDFTSTMTGLGAGPTIDVLGRTLFPHSLGILYTAVCQFIGYDRYGDEGKVMGLAPYGRDTYQNLMCELVPFEPGGRFRLNLDYFVHHAEGVDYSFDEAGRPTVAPLYSQRLVQCLGRPRARDTELGEREMDLARSLQCCLQRSYCHLLEDLHRRTSCNRLCLAGGVALNSVANGVVLGETPFNEIYVQPAAGDDGTALGAAYWVLNCRLGRPRTFIMRHAYTGPQFSDSEVRSALDRAGVNAEWLDNSELIERTARAVADGKIVGWFQGAMEWGPRALGNRSIVAHPGHPGIRDTLNARVKCREWFRPFAPSILEERLSEYFESDHPSPFMLMVYRTRPEVRGELCAVNHVDNTGRVQTVARSENPRFYALIEAFARMTGTPVVLNTSFNENEPIVCTPDEAVSCFARTRMDALAVGNFFCEKLGGRPVRRTEAAGSLERNGN